MRWLSDEREVLMCSKILNDNFDSVGLVNCATKYFISGHTFPIYLFPTIFKYNVEQAIAASSQLAFFYVIWSAKSMNEVHFITC